MPSSTASDIRDYVAAKQLPQAAKAAKDALDRGAHVQLATGILLGIGAQDVNENMAASLCLCFQDMLTCDAGARRESAARLLMTAMKSIVMPLSDSRSTTNEFVNASSVDITMAQPCPQRAAAFARAMTRTMACCEVADVLAKSCMRVSSLHGTARNPDALRAYARCPLFSKPGVAVQAASKVLLLAAVRSAYVMVPLPAACKPELVEALAERIAAAVLAEFPQAASVRVRLAKPGAVRYAESVGVAIERRRGGLPA